MSRERHSVRRQMNLRATNVPAQNYMVRRSPCCKSSPPWHPGSLGRPRCTAASTTTFSSSVSKHPLTPRCLVLVRSHRLPGLLLERRQCLRLPQLLLFLPQLLHLSQDGVLSFPLHLLSTEESEIARSSSSPVCCGVRHCRCGTTIVHAAGKCSQCR